MQGVASLPLLPPGKTAISQGYSIDASPNVTRPITGSVSFQYLSVDVLLEGADEEELRIHFWDTGARPVARARYPAGYVL